MIEVYMLTNIDTSKSYVGLTSRRTYGNGVLIQRAKRKHGESAFYPIILAKTDSKNEADKLERFYISLFKTLSPNGYNIALGGDGGAIHTAAMKASISAKLKGRVSPNKGRAMSSESRKKISESLYAAKFRHSEEHKLRMADMFKGRIMSDETRAKMSASAKQRASTEHGKAVLAANLKSTRGAL